MVEVIGDLIEIEVDEQGAGERLDTYLVRELSGIQDKAIIEIIGKAPSRSRIQKWIRSGNILHNGLVVKSGCQLCLGDVISLGKLPKPETHLLPIKMELDILFEDEYCIVLNKPAGVVVHPGAGETGPTIAHGILYHLGQSEGKAYDKLHPKDWYRPGIVHRLDKDTTGLLVCAKTERAHEVLSSQFAEKSNQREYVALLDGVMLQDKILIESYLHRDPKYRTRFASKTKEEMEMLRQKWKNAVAPELKGYRYAKSSFFRERVYGDRVSLARVRLSTGRTHQIRIHAKSMGLPIVGDLLYHRPTELPHRFSDSVRRAFSGVKRQMLHAALLGFKHPETGEELVFEAPVPEDFSQILHKLDAY